MNDKEIKLIKERCEKATSGPWISFVEDRDFTSGSSFIKTAREDIYLSGATVADQDFIAACRQDIPILIDEVLRLRTQVTRAEAFEEMLNDIQKQACYEQTEMDKLKAAGKVKSATYRQFFGNRLFYRMIMDKYREFGLVD